MKEGCDLFVISVRSGSEQKEWRLGYVERILEAHGCTALQFENQNQEEQHAWSLGGGLFRSSQVLRAKEIIGLVVAAGEGIMKRLLIQWWLWDLIHVIAAGNEGTVEGNQRAIEGCSITGRSKGEFSLHE